uniref:Uncharacterized protein n=1 Tax=Favella ehrenbergii TaxID=182087 RepID=A0A7S3MMV1_9SPIT|mmetsp:Transcript_2077/g.2804  ORF Transcript_2077/g.2804 Transcript_2077/m.2804 type:complete len:141 (+) Transcript_2077:402-824(+)
MDDRALNQLVSIKHYRPFRHLKDGEEGANVDEFDYDKKHRKNKEKSVNIHRVIALKKQFKQQVQDRLEMVKQIEQNALEQEKSKFIKDKKSKKEERRKGEKTLKKRKFKESKKQDGDGEGNEGEDDGVAKKKKRMSLYGL